MPIDPTAISPIITAIFAWVWSTYGEKIKEQAIEGTQGYLTDTAASKTGELWGRMKWQQAANDYSQKVKTLYGTMRVLGQPAPVDLSGIYTDVHMLSKPTALRRYSIEQLKEQYSQPLSRSRLKERQGGLAVVQRTDKLFILGKPGAGKTTFMKHLALQAIEGQIERVPIFVSLKELADSEDEVLDFIVQQFEICDFPEAQPFIEYLLEAGKAIILFDGLDEVQQANDQRSSLSTALENFTRQYNANHYVMTCRIAATSYQFRHFTYVEMADFSSPQIQTFVRKWFKDKKDVGDDFLKQLEQPQHKGLQTLAEIPLLLTLLCIAFEETLSFPQRRVEIYEEALDALLKKWDSSRKIRRDEIYHKLSLGRKRQMFARIAAQTFKDSMYFIPQRTLERQIVDYLRHVPPTRRKEDIDGEDVLKSIEAQHGIFVERARQIHSFAHLTFQEYYTAKYIVDNAAYGTLKGLINTHLSDDKWREVFLLTASLLDQADTFFELFIDQLNQLIANDKKLVSLLTWANNKAMDVPSIHKPAALRSWFIYLGRGLELDLIPDFDGAFTLNYALPLALNQSRNQYYMVALALDRVFDSALNRVSNRVFNRDHFLWIDYFYIFIYKFTKIVFLAKKDTTLDNRSVIPSLIDHVNGVIQQLIRLSENLNLHDLRSVLEKLTVPTRNSSPSEWQVFHTGIRDIMVEHRNLRTDWNFTYEQNRLLNRYLKGTQFLLECLDLAYVSDRERIEARLLLPPPGVGA